MKMAALTSLADLVFKAKTDRHYKQLARITAARLRDGKYSISGITYEEALEYLYGWAKAYYQADTCETTVGNLNYYRCRVVEEKDPVPAVEAVAATPPILVPQVDDAKKLVIEMIKSRKASTEAEISSDYQTFFRGDNERMFNYADYDRRLETQRRARTQEQLAQEEALRARRAENRDRDLYRYYANGFVGNNYTGNYANLPDDE